MLSKKNKKKNSQHKFHNGVYDEEFAVESILDKKVVNGIAQYKIKWVGYPLSDCTWEPFSHLENVKDMVARFEYNLLSNIPAETKPKPEVKEKPKEKSSEDSCKLYLSVAEDKAIMGELEIDYPKKIISGRKINDKVICTVEWKQRIDGIKPENSEVLSDELKEDYYDLLLDFYESKIIFT